MKSPISFIAFVLLTGCATPVNYATGPYKRLDKNTEYCVVDSPNGFTTSVICKRYQFIPESEAVAMAGKSALLSAAYAEADARGRKIERIDEQRIRMSMGRNGITGVTTWSGSVPVFYRR